MSRVFESDLPTTEKFVLLAMADYASDSGESIFPSIETLARKTSLSDRSVQNAIKMLIEDGYLEMACKGWGRNNTNRYRILCSRFDEATAPIIKGERATPINKKGESSTLKGETGTLKGEAPSPDPSLTVIESLDIYGGESGNFLSKLDVWVGCVFGNPREDVDTASVMVEEYGLERVKRCATWAKDKGFSTMRTALRSMNTALRNGGFQDERPPSRKGSNTTTDIESLVDEMRMWW
jgi:hypothetical protein